MEETEGWSDGRFDIRVSEVGSLSRSDRRGGIFVRSEFLDCFRPVEEKLKPGLIELRVEARGCQAPARYIPVRHANYMYLTFPAQLPFQGTLSQRAAGGPCYSKML